MWVKQGLFWRLPPSQSQSSGNRPGVKRDKTRISIVCFVDSSGTDRLPIWVIGKARTPRAFRNINIPAIGPEWRILYLALVEILAEVSLETP